MPILSSILAEHADLTECARWVATSEEEHAVSVETHGPAPE